MGVSERLRGPVIGWQGQAAETMEREAGALADSLVGWADQAGRLARSVNGLAVELDRELVRRRHVRLSVLDALGRLATLPADIHRDVSGALAHISTGRYWQGEEFSFAYPITIRLPQLGADGWDAALTTLRSFLP